MRNSSWVGFGLLLLALSACRRSYNEGGTDVSDFKTGMSTLRGGAFGLGSKELVLTLDDGPGSHTVGLARWLKKRGVPTTFFMNYSNGSFGVSGATGQSRLKAICELGFHLVANHSDGHSFTDRSWNQINDAHSTITRVCPQNYIFFRAPGGNWNASDATSLNAQKDQQGRPLSGLYIGPVFWDVDGEDYTSTCRNSPSTCRSNYLRLITGRSGPSIVLAHDIHESTIEMLMGSNWRALVADENANDPNDGLIGRAQAAGYKWVALDRNQAKIRELLGEGASLPVASFPAQCKVSSSDGFANIRSAPNGTLIVRATEGAEFTGLEAEGLWIRVSGNVDGRAIGQGAEKAFIHSSLLSCTALQSRPELGAIECPQGYSIREVGSDGGRLCTDGTNAWGPFTEGMVRKCIEYGGGEEACRSDRWAVGMAVNLRGTGVCPVGATLDSVTGYCAENGNAFGPFPAALVAKCETAGGGPACKSSRWSRNFLKGLMGR